MVDGVAVVVDNYARNLLKFAEVYVFAPKSSDRTFVDNFPYKVIRSQSYHIPLTDYDLSFPIFDIQFQKKMKKITLDIVHIHSPFAIGLCGIDYARRHNIPLIGTLHSQYKQDFFERTKSKILSEVAIKEIMKRFNKCDQLFAVSQKVSEVFFEYGASKMPEVILNATDLCPFSDDDYIEKLKRKYQISHLEKILLYVGRLDKIKNLDFLFESLVWLKNSEFLYKMIFVGKGPFEAGMRKKIELLGLSSQTIFTGKISDRLELSALYKLADLFLFPSLYDTSSLVQIEAASQCTPSLFLKQAVTASMISDGINGYLADDYPSAYGKKIIEIFTNLNSFSIVKENVFRDLYRTWDEIVIELNQKYMELYRLKQNNMKH
jgi:glycosyltransferase involved in cell wall biosynthesis